MDPHEPQLIRRYLLGQLLSDERAQVEQRFLSDSDFFQEILIGEEDLVDDYIGHQLSDTEIQAFESNFLVTPERRKQLRFAERLAKYLGETDETEVDEPFSEASAKPSTDSDLDQGKVDSGKADPEKIDPGKKQSFFSFFPALSPALSYALAAVILVAVVGIAWLALRNKTTPSGRSGTILAVTLGPGLTRDGGEITRIKPTAETESVEIRLIIPAINHQIYRTRLLADDRSELWASGDLTPVEEPGNTTTAPVTNGTRVVVSTIPARLLAPGDYRIALTARTANGAFEDLAIYPFRVLR